MELISRTAIEQSKIKDKLKKIVSATVGIAKFSPELDKPCYCSGVHIGGGLVLTTSHLFDGDEEAERIVVFQEGRRWQASLEATASGIDMLVLELHNYHDELTAPVVHDEKSEYKFVMGEDLLYFTYIPKIDLGGCQYVGNAAEYFNQNKELIPSFLFPFNASRKYTFILSPYERTTFGNSGSGVYNKDGTMVGLITAGTLPECKINMSAAISTSALREFKL